MLHDTSIAQDFISGAKYLAYSLVQEGIQFGTGYPGSPVVEVMDELVKFGQKELFCFKYGINEKIAFEMAASSSFLGEKAVCIMKNAGLNVCLDTVSHVAYSGVSGAFLLIVGDDPSCESSSTENDTRLLAHYLGIPCLQAACIQDIPQVVGNAIKLSENFRTLVILRVTQELAHSSEFVTVLPLQKVQDKKLEKLPENLSKNFIVIPFKAQQLHKKAIGKIEEIKKIGNGEEFNILEIPDNIPPIGFIVDSPTLNAFRRATKRLGIDPAILCPHISWPLASEITLSFAEKFKRIIVIEQLEPVLEDQVVRYVHEAQLETSISGFEIFPRYGTLDEEILLSLLSKEFDISFQDCGDLDQDLLVRRTPTFCPGCPHSAFYFGFTEVRNRLPYRCFVGSDVGCYALGVKKGIDVGNTLLCMGSSIGVATGMALRNIPSFAIIGDSTFLHAGIPSLLNSVELDVNLVVCILDNFGAAMTGGQSAPKMKRNESKLINIVKGLGVENVKSVNPFDIESLKKNLFQLLECKGVSVLISSSPCAKMKVKVGGRYSVDLERCSGSGECLTQIHCPALSFSKTKQAEIDFAFCNNCGLCASVCPEKAIYKIDDNESES